MEPPSIDPFGEPRPSASASRFARLRVFVAVAAVFLGCSEAPKPRNAILIVLDTLRADRVSAYGHERETTPVLDDLARKGVLFESAVSHAAWTLPAMVGLLSGRYPTAAVYDGGLRSSLVERLRDAGFQTAAFTGGAWVGEQYGFGRGFDVFEDQIAADLRLARAPERGPGDDPEFEASKGIEKTFAAAERWLEAHADEPFFLWVHTYEPHTPYRRQLYTEGMDTGIIGPTFEVATAALAGSGRPGFRFGETELAYIRALYDGGVTVSDQYVGKLLETLDRLGRSDDTLIVVTSDHGEDLGDRTPPRPGNHGHAWWDELLLVPLIVFDPTRAYPLRRVPAQVRLIDTLPTVLDLLGVAVPGAGQGESLGPLMRGDETADRLAGSVLDEDSKRARPQQFAVRSGGLKLILTPAVGKGEPDRIEVFDLREDPHELRNVAAAKGVETKALLRAVAEMRGDLAAGGQPRYRSKRPLPPPVKRRLRALGYLE